MELTIMKGRYGQDGPAEEDEKDVVGLPPLEQSRLQVFGVVVQEVQVHQKGKSKTATQQERPRKPPNLRGERGGKGELHEI